MTTTAFDISRAHLADRPFFQPFYPRQTQSLAGCLATGKVAAKDHVLVLERKGGVLALDVKQMSYHHVAQGEFAGGRPASPG